MEFAFNSDLERFDPQLWLVVGTFLSALVSLAIASILWRQTNHLKSQTESIQKQEQNRIRPWIIIGDMNRITSDVNGALYSVNIKNIGLDYAEAVYSKFMKKFESFTISELIKNGEEFKSFPLMPNEEYPFLQK